MDRTKVVLELKRLGFTARPKVGAAIVQAIAPVAYIGVTMAVAQTAPVTLPLAVLFIATRYRHAANVVHWASHFSGCEDKMINEIIFKCVCAFLGWNPCKYRAQHLSHHVHLGDYDKDGDFGAHRDFDLGRQIGIKNRVKQIFTKRFWLQYAPKLGFADRWQATCTVVAICVLGLTVGLGWYYAALTWVVGKFAIYPLIRFFSDVVDHGGIYEEDIKTRNCIIETKIMREIVFPSNDCFHALHHEYMGIPAQHQEDAHLYLMDVDEVYARRIHSVIEQIDSALGKRPLSNVFKK